MVLWVLLGIATTMAMSLEVIRFRILTLLYLQLYHMMAIISLIGMMAIPKIRVQ